MTRVEQGVIFLVWTGGDHPGLIAENEVFALFPHHDERRSFPFVTMSTGFWGSHMSLISSRRAMPREYAPLRRMLYGELGSQGMRPHILKRTHGADRVILEETTLHPKFLWWFLSQYNLPEEL